MQQQINEQKLNLKSRLWRISKVLLFIAPILTFGSLNVLTLVNSKAHSAGVSFIKTILAPILAEATITRLLSESPIQRYTTLEKSYRALDAKHVQKYAALEKSYRALDVKHYQLKKVSDARSLFAKEISTKIARRTAIGALKNVSTYPAKIVPALGTVTISAMTVYDLYEDCQTIKDLNALSEAFEHKTTHDDTICGIKFP